MQNIQATSKAKDLSEYSFLASKQKQWKRRRHNILKL